MQQCGRSLCGVLVGSHSLGRVLGRGGDDEVGGGGMCGVALGLRGVGGGEGEGEDGAVGHQSAQLHEGGAAGPLRCGQVEGAGSAVGGRLGVGVGQGDAPGGEGAGDALAGVGDGVFGARVGVFGTQRAGCGGQGEDGGLGGPLGGGAAAGAGAAARATACCSCVRQSLGEGSVAVGADVSGLGVVEGDGVVVGGVEGEADGDAVARLPLAGEGGGAGGGGGIAGCAGDAGDAGDVGGFCFIAGLRAQVQDEGGGGVGLRGASVVHQLVGLAGGEEDGQ